jgi:DNA-binding NarL/FixJ family response regulator
MLGPNGSTRPAVSRDIPHLTPREGEVLALLTGGKTNRAISNDLHLTERTIKAHLSSIYRKLGVSNRTEAALLGLQIFSVWHPPS